MTGTCQAETAFGTACGEPVALGYTICHAHEWFAIQRDPVLRQFIDLVDGAGVVGILRYIGVHARYVTKTGAPAAGSKDYVAMPRRQLVRLIASFADVEALERNSRS